MKETPTMDSAAALLRRLPEIEVNWETFSAEHLRELLGLLSFEARYRGIEGA